MDGVKTVKTWLISQVADFSDKGTQKLILQYKSPSSGYDYVEK
jgi:hypothetical protein